MITIRRAALDNGMQPEEDRSAMRSPLPRPLFLPLAAALPWLLVACATAGDKVTRAEVVYRLAPVYPAAAQARGIEGWVKLAFTVTKEGRTRDIRILAADPPGVFNQSAIDTVSRLRYRPETVNGRPVDAEGYTVLLRYELPE